MLVDLKIFFFGGVGWGGHFHMILCIPDKLFYTVQHLEIVYSQTVLLPPAVTSQVREGTIRFFYGTVFNN